MREYGRPTISGTVRTIEEQVQVVTTLSAADMEEALIDWARRKLGFDPPEGADIEVEIREEGCDDHGTEGQPAFARLTAKLRRVTGSGGI